MAGSSNSSKDRFKTIKTSTEVFVETAPSKRFSILSNWFVVLAIVGVIFLLGSLFTVYTGGMFFSSAAPDSSAIDNVYSAIGELNTSGVITNQQAQAMFDQMKDIPPVSAASDGFGFELLIVAVIVFILGLVYLASFYKILFAKSRNQVEFAIDVVKTLTGFFVGVGSAIIGI